MITTENDTNNSDDNSDYDDNNNNDSDNDENHYDDDNYDNKLPVDSLNKGPIILSFDVTFIESKNNSRVPGDLRCHVLNVTVMWYIYATLFIRNCARCN